MSTIQPAEMMDLEEIKSLTELIRGHQRAIEEISTIRRNLILGVRNKRITYREIAAAMEVTEQSVYKILRPSIANAKAKAAEEAAKTAEETTETITGE